MVDQYRKLKDQLQNVHHNDEGTMRLGVSTNFARFMLPSILKEYLHFYPKIQFNVITSWSRSILNMAERDSINLGIIRGDHLWEHEKILLRKEPIYVISKDPIQLKDLPEKSRIVFNTDPSLEQTINQSWQQNFVKPSKVTMKIDRIETCTKMVENGLGYAITPRISLSEHNQLQKVELLDENTP